ncbi:hypothetical protein [Caballeronia pedi]|nr:hypothetical protein [Caballeronia pedi]
MPRVGNIAAHTKEQLRKHQIEAVGYAHEEGVDRTTSAPVHGVVPP